MNTLIIFAKVPERGKVKTRLYKTSLLNESEVERLYEAFLKDVLVASLRTAADRVLVGYYPPDKTNRMKQLVQGLTIPKNRRSRLHLFPQKGNRFDNRIQYAYTFAKRKNGNGPIVLIGSDSPQLQPALIDRSFRFLTRRKGAVAGPSSEGGMYLIGFHSERIINFKKVFTQGNELDNLMDRIQSEQIPFLLLQEMTDVDVESDLITLVGLLRAMRYSNRYRNLLLPRYTLAVIEELGLSVDRPAGSTRGKRLRKKK